jgi:hypothetical protein
LIRQTLHHHNHQQHTLPSLPGNQRTMNGYIPEVNPYAAPVPVPTGHEYEDIGTALRDINSSFGVTLPHNFSQQQHRGQRLNALSAPHHSLRRPSQPLMQHQPHPAHPHQQAVEETLYYEACRDGQVIYGRNSVPNYCIHNTRSPIYYSEGTRR